MKKIGLTGGIASGKSTCLDILIENGFKTIDSDKIVREILLEDREVLNFIKENFGEKFICNGKLLNKEFGKFIFSNRNYKMKYENFIMPKIIRRIDEKFFEFEKNNEKLCILDAPILIERNLHKHMDYVVVVWVSKDEQLKRVINRDGLDEKSARDRINSQMDIDLKREFADFLIDNSKGREQLNKQVKDLCLFLKTL